MGSAIDRSYILGLTVKTLRVCGVAGLVGIAVATAVGQLGANQADIKATSPKVNVPSTSPSKMVLDLRQDRLDQSRQRAAKVDRQPMPAPVSTHFVTQKPITTVEIPDVPQLSEPVHLAPWLEGETMTLSEAIAPESAVPDPLDSGSN